MREEYAVAVLQRGDFERDGQNAQWHNAKFWYPGQKNVNDRYCKTLDEAHAVLNHAYKLWNGTKVYDEKGERITTQEVVPGIGVSVVHTKETDRRMEIVKHEIRRRYVSEWETVEEGE